MSLPRRPLLIAAAAALATLAAPAARADEFPSKPVAPKGIRPALRDRINADVAKVLAEPDVKARFDTFAFESPGWSPDEIERQAAAKSRVYGELVKRKSISLE